jgi:uncharacterized protein
LHKALGDDHEVFSPRMPNKQNAKYEHWKVWLEKMIPFLRDGGIFIGHSLGGSFLVKYLSENEFPKKIKTLILVAAATGGTDGVGDFAFDEPIGNIENICQGIYILQSKDDPVVPVSDAEFFQKNWPSAKMILFEDKQHFNQEEFPEIVELIRKIK